MEKLLPCPFCGSKPVLKESDMWSGVYEVFCKNCGSRVGDVSSLEYGTTKKEAIKLWNHRVEQKFVLVVHYETFDPCAIHVKKFVGNVEVENQCLEPEGCEITKIEVMTIEEFTKRWPGIKLEKEEDWFWVPCEE